MKFTGRLLVTFGIFLLVIAGIYTAIVVLTGRPVAITPVAILFANAIFFFFIALMFKAAPAMDYMRENRETTVDRELPPPVEKEVAVVEPPPEGVHIPDPSYWPVVLAVAVMFIIIGFMFHIQLNVFITAGVVLIIAAALGWCIEAWKERAELVAHEKDEHAHDH